MSVQRPEELEQGSGSDGDTSNLLGSARSPELLRVNTKIAGLVSVFIVLFLGTAYLASPIRAAIHAQDLNAVENLQAAYPATGYPAQQVAAPAQQVAAPAQQVAAPAQQAAAPPPAAPPVEPWQKLVCTQAADANAGVSQADQKIPTEQWFPAQAACTGRFTLPAQPAKATDYNGMALPDTCFQGASQTADGHHHVFLIGDWGGLPGPIAWNASMKAPIPADHRDPIHFQQHTRDFVWGADDKAQQNVAAQMRTRAATSAPDYILNVGDNFYWGGVNVKCGAVPETADRTRQWGTVFEQVYTGPGIDGKQWLGVLGNHDFGGFYFVSGWDQAIMYSWQVGGVSTNRWVTPALYYSSKVVYADFSIDYYFIDSNVWDVWQPAAEAHHNICSEAHNPPAPQDNCGITGPVSAADCTQWFHNMWNAEKTWLQNSVPKSTAEWQIVITHFPPEGTWGGPEWASLSMQLGLDMMLVGHRHRQEMHKSSSLAPTLYVVSGGGGGITSENLPTADGQDDEYGFVDLTLSREEIMLEMISHGGQIRSTTCTTPRDPGATTLRPLSGVSMCQGKPLGVQPLAGQGTYGQSGQTTYGQAAGQQPYGQSAPDASGYDYGYGQDPYYGSETAASNPLQQLAANVQTALSNIR